MSGEEKVVKGDREKRGGEGEEDLRGSEEGRMRGGSKEEEEE